MAFIQDLPDEILLKVSSFLNIKDLVKFGHVSKRMRKIRSDESLWQKINLSKCEPGNEGYYVNTPIDIPNDLVKMVIENGCKYLSLLCMKVRPIFIGSLGDLRLDKPSSLRYLDLKYCEANINTFEEILDSCHSLQKLSLASRGQRSSTTVDFLVPKLSYSLTSKMIRSIYYQNGHSLQTLNLSFWNGLDLESIKKITKNCVDLKNIDLAGTKLSKDSIKFLVTNLTPNVEKLDLGYIRNLEDEDLKALVARCNKLSFLNLQLTSVTDISLTHIIENLQHTLEKLNVYMGPSDYGIDITYTKLTELKSIPKLKVLNFWGTDQEKEDLKKVMPFVRFGEIGDADERELSAADGIWDVKAKQLEYCKKREKSQFQDLPNDWPSLI